MSHANAWTEAEDRALIASQTYGEYIDRSIEVELEPRDRGAAISRRYALKQKGVNVPEWPRGAKATVFAANGTRLESQLESRLESDDDGEPFGFRARDEDEDVRDYWEAQKRALAAHQRRLERKSNRIIRHTTDDPEQPFGIFFFGDTHLGSSGILAERMDEEFELMRQACETMGARMVFMGDAIENAKIHGKAAPATYEQAFGPATQIDIAELLFSPLAPYFLAFLEGNHDSRDAAQGGIGWLHQFAKRIGAPYVSEAGCSIHLTHGFQRYVIFARHDWRGKSQINKANSLRRFFSEYPDEEFQNADVCVLAHLHEPLYESPQQKGRRVHWIRTGSLKVHDAYAARGGFTPEPGTATVIFWPNERRIKVSLDLEEGIAALEDAQRRYASVG